MLTRNKTCRPLPPCHRHLLENGASVHVGALPRWLRHWRAHLQCGRPGFHSWVGKIPWRRAWQPTLLLLPGEFHGQRSLPGYNPRGRRVRHDEWLSTVYTAEEGTLKPGALSTKHPGFLKGRKGGRERGKERKGKK